MFRPLIVAALFAGPALAQAQNFWQLDDPEPFAKRKPAEAPAEKAKNAAPQTDKPDGKPGKGAAVVPMSPNRIVGRILWVDTKKTLCVVSFDGAPFDRTATLMARTLDCAPRAVLAPIPSNRTSATAAYRVTHGAAAKDLELILPCDAALNAACMALPRVSAPDAAPKKN